MSQHKTRPLMASASGIFSTKLRTKLHISCYHQWWREFSKSGRLQIHLRLSSLQIDCMKSETLEPVCVFFDHLNDHILLLQEVCCRNIWIQSYLSSPRFCLRVGTRVHSILEQKNTMSFWDSSEGWNCKAMTAC